MVTKRVAFSLLSLSLILTLPVQAQDLAEPVPIDDDEKPEVGEVIPGEYVVAFIDGEDSDDDKTIDARGDLDFYVTGADGQSFGAGFGMVANQLYENLIIP